MYSAPRPTGRPTTNRSALEKRGVPTAHKTVCFDSLVGTSAWTAPNASSLPQSWTELDTSYPWDPNWLDLDSSFDFGLVTNAPPVAGPDYSNTAYLTTADPIERLTAGITSTKDPSAGRLPNLWSPPSDTDTTETCIKQLSDLSVRLYLVYKTSCKLAAAQNEHPEILISSFAFETAAAYLQGDNTRGKSVIHGCEALDELFSSTRSLLDILQLVSDTTVASSLSDPTNISAQVPVENDDPISTTRSEASPPSAFFSFSPQLTASSASTGNMSLVGNTPSDMPTSEAITGRSPLPTAGEHDPDGVILHLVLACYTRLLHIYHKLIVALHRDATRLKKIESGSQSSLSELRLVLFVQLITHLLNRLRKAMADYLSLLIKKNRTDSMNVAAGTTSRMQASELNLHELWSGNVSNLERNVRHELQQLQKKSQNL